MTRKTQSKSKKCGLRYGLAFVVTSAIIVTACFTAVSSVLGCNVTITQQTPEGVPASTLQVKTDRVTVRKVLENNDIALGSLDEVNYDLDDKVEDKAQIIITRKTPIVISIGDEKIALATAKNRVSEVLAEGDIEYSKDDIVTPSLEANVGENREIDVVRVNSDEETRIEYTDYKTEYRDDDTIEADVVIQDGIKGETEIKELVRYADGKEVSRKELSREVKSKPQNEIIARATGKKKESNENGSNTNVIDVNGLKYTKKLDMVATAYSAYTPDGNYGTTAMGITSRYGVVAVDKNVIPLGTKVYVENYGVAIAADTGGAIKGNRIDLCFEDTEEHLNAYGRQNINVYILEDQN